MGNPNDLYEKILQRSPSPGTLVLILEKLREEGRYAYIVQASLAALQLYPDDIRIRGQLADAYLQMGFMGQAVTELGKVTAAVDELATAYKQQAMLYARQGRTEEAVRSLRRYLNHHPEDGEAVALLANSTEDQTLLHEEMEMELASPTLAEIYVGQGQIQEAVDTYEKVIRKNAEDQIYQQRLAELKSMLDHEQSQPGSDETLRRDPTRRAIHMLEAWLADIRESHV